MDGCAEVDDRDLPIEPTRSCATNSVIESATLETKVYYTLTLTEKSCCGRSRPYARRSGRSSSHPSRERLRPGAEHERIVSRVSCLIAYHTPTHIEVLFIRQRPWRGDIFMMQDGVPLGGHRPGPIERENAPAAS